MPVFLRAPDANQLILTDYVIQSVSEELAVSFPKNIADANQSDSKNEKRGREKHLKLKVPLEKWKK